MLLGALSHAAETKPFGIEKRIPWTTSRIIGSPEPPAPYITEPAFPKLQFDHAVDLVAAPGSDRLFVAEHQSARIFSFPKLTDAEKPELFLDLHGDGREIWSLAFHPGFATNGFVYVCYNDKKPRPDRNRVSRFHVEQTSSPSLGKGSSLHSDPNSEFILLEWATGGHNGGCIKFGLDGFLYISAGDGAGIGDELSTGQFVGDLLASILRIDVDKTDLGHTYGIPSDNPFLTFPNARPEVWAYGLRNPWRMSIDRETGELWVGDVGQDLWESVLLVKRGGNYGWSAMEGNHVYNPNIKPGGPSPFTPPVFEHGHDEARSLTGGFVYRGSRLKELRGAYIYADYETGKIWMLRYDGQRVTEHRELFQSPLHFAGLGEDNDGELYFVAYEGSIHRLAPAPNVTQTLAFPRKLSESGLFVSTKTLQPTPGLIPYDVNVPLWSDGATKERFIALPNESKIGFELEGGWDLPEGAVLVKTFWLDMDRGNTNSARRLETRLLTLQQGLWHGYTYLWNEEQTDADLLGPAGTNRTYTIRDSQATGGTREQTWHFPSRSECILCHTKAVNWVLGLNTLQMNKDHLYGHVMDNQLRTLEHLALFTNALPKGPSELPRLCNPHDATASTEARARSYLHANCAHCHVDYGGGNARFQLLYTLALDKTGILNTLPQNGNLGIAEARIVAPGEPDRSLIPYRMAKLGQGRMPHVASSVVDEDAVKLIRDWIRQMPRTGVDTLKR
jgi:uncharacterized repeat protein (TIGR03806 family)